MIFAGWLALGIIIAFWAGHGYSVIADFQQNCVAYDAKVIEFEQILVTKGAGRHTPLVEVQQDGRAYRLSLNNYVHSGPWALRPKTIRIWVDRRNPRNYRLQPPTDYDFRLHVAIMSVLALLWAVASWFIFRARR